MTDFLSFLFIKLLLSSFFQDYLVIGKNISNKKQKFYIFPSHAFFIFKCK